jgi:hypothetical protein
MTDPLPPPVQPPEVAELPWMRCPLCDSELAPHQDWCLNCGAPARTRIAPTPNWRMPLVALVIALAISGAGLAYAFVKLSSGTGSVGKTATTAPATVTTLTAAPATPAVTPPAASTPALVTPTTPPTPATGGTPAGTPTRTIPTNPPATIPGTTHP